MTVREGDVVQVGSLVGRVIETPGHTAGHISYWFKEDKLAFVGDTLFSVGCGRILEGNAEMMWAVAAQDPQSARRHAKYFAATNTPPPMCNFALTIEPKNLALRTRAEEVVQLVEQKRPTIPTTIQQEKSYNPFLRADLHSVAGAIGMEGAPPAQVFGAIRARKDKF